MAARSNRTPLGPARAGSSRESTSSINSRTTPRHKPQAVPARQSPTTHNQVQQEKATPSKPPASTSAHDSSSPSIRRPDDSRSTTTNLSCLLCGVRVASASLLEAHNNSRRHRVKVWESNSQRNTRKTDSPSDPVVASPPKEEALQEQRSEPRGEVFPMLPLEMVVYICSFLDAATLIRCSLVSKSWNDIVQDNTLWRRLYLDDENILPLAKEKLEPNGTEFEWPKAYRTAYQALMVTPTITPIQPQLQQGDKLLVVVEHPTCSLSLLFYDTKPRKILVVSREGRKPPLEVWKPDRITQSMQIDCALRDATDEFFVLVGNTYTVLICNWKRQLVKSLVVYSRILEVRCHGNLVAIHMTRGLRMYHVQLAAFLWEVDCSDYGRWWFYNRHLDDTKSVIIFTAEHELRFYEGRTGTLLGQLPVRTRVDTVQVIENKFLVILTYTEVMVYDMPSSRSAWGRLALRWKDQERHGPALQVLGGYRNRSNGHLRLAIIGGDYTLRKYSLKTGEKKCIPLSNLKMAHGVAGLECHRMEIDEYKIIMEVSTSTGSQQIYIIDRIHHMLTTVPGCDKYTWCAAFDPATPCLALNSEDDMVVVTFPAIGQ